MTPIKLVVGLGNPGPTYAQTRHNIGACFVEDLARREGIPLNLETKFKGHLGRGRIGPADVRLLVPATYMNDSGQAVAAIANFYKMEPAEILVAYDEMAFEPGQVRLKTGGGDNGHNGIRSIVQCLGKQKGFHRLRIGVGHPGSPAKVTAYLTSHTMPADERIEVERALEFPNKVLDDLLKGDLQSAMLALHTDPRKPADDTTEQQPEGD